MVTIVTSNISLKNLIFIYLYYISFDYYILLLVEKFLKIVSNSFYVNLKFQLKMCSLKYSNTNSRSYYVFYCWSYSGILANPHPIQSFLHHPYPLNKKPHNNKQQILRWTIEKLKYDQVHRVRHSMRPPHIYICLRESMTFKPKVNNNKHTIRSIFFNTRQFEMVSNGLWNTNNFEYKKKKQQLILVIKCKTKN